jgi:hypothetical protein
MREHTEEACESIDATIFSGDILFNPTERAELKEYVRRWYVAIESHEAQEELDSERNEMNRENETMATILKVVENLSERVAQLSNRVDQMNQTRFGPGPTLPQAPAVDPRELKFTLAQKNVVIYRYIRRTDLRTFTAESNSGLCIRAVLDFNKRMVFFSWSLCQGENFSKEIARQTAAHRYQEWADEHKNEFSVDMPEVYDNRWEEDLVRLFIGKAQELALNKQYDYAPRVLIKYLEECGEI